MKYRPAKSIIPGQQLLAMPAPQYALRLAMLFQ
jgi:hypothetical protein